MNLEIEKPADLVPGRSDQRASERRVEVVGGVKCEDIAAYRPSSITSITRKSHPVKAKAKEKY
jgi:hypothetical protein